MPRNKNVKEVRICRVYLEGSEIPQPASLEAERNGGGKWVPTPVAIIISAAVFALAHLTPGEFPQLFVLGSALGISYAQTRNLLTPITIHAIWNSGVILLLTVLQIRAKLEITSHPISSYSSNLLTVYEFVLFPAVGFQILLQLQHNPTGKFFSPL
ncbi:CAAX amino terminal protease family protein [Trifolium pratense]|uniref:CAAX amino terminal protease family protein n=1 Tax=Trifolium pratense TaxID=57577 RepID=A0A2K3N1D8_TRIPR|nr:CAAX amino terminal protease family protein [Trifolium pratense]